LKSFLDYKVDYKQFWFFGLYLNGVRKKKVSNPQKSGLVLEEGGLG